MKLIYNNHRIMELFNFLLVNILHIAVSCHNLVSNKPAGKTAADNIMVPATDEEKKSSGF